jgi:hypothetical protein
MTTLNLTHSEAARKTSGLVFFKINDRSGLVQFHRSLFADIPATMTLTGVFAAPKAKETPAERKARLALLPKLTPQEKLSKLEEKLAKMKARLAGTSTPAAITKPVVTPAPAASTKPPVLVKKAAGKK